MYVRRKERRTADACNWVVRGKGVQGMEECTKMAAFTWLWRSKTEDVKAQHQLFKADVSGGLVTEEE